MGEETECASEKWSRTVPLIGTVDSTLWDFSFSTMGQETRWSCWFAAMRILYQWGKEQGKGTDPDDVKKLVTAGTFGGSDADFTAACDKGLAKEKRASAYTDVKLTVYDRATVAAWSLMDLIGKVHSNGPMILTMTIDQGGGNWTTHATVIRGADNSKSNVSIIDPYDQTALDTATPPYKAMTQIWTFKDYQTKLPPDGSISAATTIGQLP